MKKAHGIMFHHFHDETKHIVGQGSISGATLDALLDYYGRDHKIIPAKEFLQKSIEGTLHEDEVCLTFDDGLLCQYDIAYPVLKKRGLTAFYFVYTSPMDGVLEKVEVHRHFRFSKFSDIESFYSAFFQILSKNDPAVMKELSKYDPDQHLQQFPFYTPNDKRFRYARDTLLGTEKYYAIMDSMIKEYDYDVEANAKLLWIKPNQIKELYDNGNIIGLHSYSHPTVMIGKNDEEQKKEYEKNKAQLEHVIGDKVVSVSYPCNSYNDFTLKCMENMGIQIGFRANMEDFVLNNQKLEYPREDHANIIRKMEEEK